MTTALGNKAITETLLATTIGNNNKRVDTIYVDNIIPAPGGITPNLDNVCQAGNTTNENILIQGGSRLDTLIINEPADSIHIRGRVGLGTDPSVPLTEDVEIDGNVQIDTTGLGRITFYDKAQGHEHGEYDADDDGVNGGRLLMKTKADGGALATRMVIRENGRIGINTINPTTVLDVNGNINGNGTITATGAVSGSDLNCVDGLLSFQQMRRRTKIVGTIGAPEILNVQPIASRKSYTLDAGDFSMTLYCQPVAVSNQTLVFELDTNINNVLENNVINVSSQTARINGGQSLGFNNVAVGPSVKTPADTSIITVLVNLSTGWTTEVLKVRVNIDNDGF